MVDTDSHGYPWGTMSIRPGPASNLEEEPPGGNGAAQARPAGSERSGRRAALAAPPVVPDGGRQVVVRPGRRRTVIYDDQSRKPGRRGPAPRVVEVRRVRRVLRRLDTWSVFRFAVLLYLCGLVVFMTAVVGVWLLASSAGAIPSIEHFITQLFALKNFRFKPRQLFFGTLGVAAVGVFLATLFTVLLAVLFNLISDVVGGIEMTVLEEEPVDSGTPPAGAAPQGPRPKR
jgi:Transmembrane domain of unknown function (DUF3566)